MADEHEAMDEGYGEFDETLSRLQEWSKELDRHWGEWNKEMRDCFRMVAGDQYEQQQYNEIKDSGKIPVTFNRIGPVIDAVTGSEIQGRQRTKFYPRQLGDAVMNEILTEGAEWIRDQSDAEGEETDAKRDAFVCGLGAVSTELEFDDDPEGAVIYKRLEPGSALPLYARQSNAIDARAVRYREHMSRDEFKSLYGDVEGIFDPVEGLIAEHNADPRHAYEDGRDKNRESNKVSVDMWQWFERETIYMSMSQDQSRLVEYSEEDFMALQEAGMQAGHVIQGVRRQRKVYYTAVLTGRRFLEEPRQMETPQFTIQFITGKRDEENGIWYGLVRPMMDPQKWANNFFSMLLHMIRTNAKGGVMIEEGALADGTDFEESLAKSDEATVVADGAITGKKIMPKPQPQYPAGIDRLMQEANDAIREVTGINQEMLGLANRDQPGVLEAQRKQAAYGILATFFESFRRYRKVNGELLLSYLRLLGPEKLVRVTADDGIRQQYVPMALALDSEKYDVIVDEAPAGPNQKERTWGMITQIIPAISDRLSPEMWAEVLKYSPFPESLSTKLRELITKAADDEKMQIIQQLQEALQGVQGQMQQADFMAEQANKAADVRNKDAKTTQTQVETAISVANPDPRPQVVS